MAHDPYAHLRASIEQNRVMTEQRSYIWWCTECEVHQADESGLCPVCKPSQPAQRDESAA